jgi:hypothetical protein
MKAVSFMVEMKATGTGVINETRSSTRTEEKSKKEGSEEFNEKLFAPEAIKGEIETRASC